MNISSTSTPAGILSPASCSQVASGSDHACDLERPRPLAVGGDPGVVPVGHLPVLDHPLRRTAGARRVGQHHLGAQLVVPLAEHRRADGQRLADGGLGRLAAEVDDGGDVHDGYASNHAPTLANPGVSRKPEPPRVSRRPPLGWSAVGGRFLERSKKCPTVGPCERSDDSPSALSCPSRWPAWPPWPATCAGPGTRRRRTSSGRSTSGCGPTSTTTRCACSAPWAASGSTSSPATTRSSSGCGSRPGRWSSTCTASAGTPARPAPTRPARSPTSRPSTASPPSCRSTPAASASWPATTSRPPPTSASRSSASACSTATATSSSRCPARAGSRRPTPSSTPTSCR